MSEQAAPGAPLAGFRRGVLLTGAGSAGNVALLFLETMFAVRWLAAEDYGIYALLVATVNFLVLAIDFGGKSAVTKMIAGAERAQQVALASGALVFRLAIAAAFAGVLWLGQSLLLLLDPSGTLRSYAGYLPLMLTVASFDELLLAILQGCRAYRPLAVAQILRSVLRLLLTVALLALFDLGVVALVYSWLLSFAVSIAYQFAALPLPKRFVWRGPLLGELLRFGLPLQVTRFLWFVVRRVDVLLLGILAGPVGVAYYSVAARVPEALQHLSESFIAVYFPTVASLLAKGERRQAGWVLNRSLRLLSFLGALVALSAVVFGQQLVVLLFSDRYEGSSLAFALLMIAFHMTFLATLMGYTLTSAGYPGRSLGQNAARSAVHLVADLLLIPALSFVGPAYAAVISSYATNPMAVLLLRRSGVAVTVAPYVKQTGLLLLCAALFWWLQPTGFAYKAGILALFLALNLLLATVCRDDLGLLLPARASGRLRARSDVSRRGEKLPRPVGSKE